MEKVRELFDTLELIGSDKESFDTAVENMSDSTSVLKIDKDNVQNLNLLAITSPKEEIIDGTVRYVNYRHDNLPSDSTEDSWKITKGWMDVDKLTKYDPDIKELLLESQEAGFLVVMKGDENGKDTLYYVSPSIQDKLQIFGIGNIGNSGEKFALLMREMVKRNFITTFREVALPDGKSVKKIFSFQSDRYAFVPQKICSNVINSIEDSKIEKLKMSKWEITQFRTLAVLMALTKEEELKEKYTDALGQYNNGTPYIEIETSDTGDCSIIIRAGFEIKSGAYKGHVIVDEMTRKHIGDVSADKIVESCKGIFDRFTMLPERLEYLKGVQVSPDPEPGETLIDSTYYEKNGKACKEFVEDVLKRTCVLNRKNVWDLLGKKRYEMYLSKITSGLQLVSKRTAYDIVSRIMATTDEVKLANRSEQIQFQKMIGRAPYFIENEKIEFRKRGHVKETAR